MSLPIEPAEGPAAPAPPDQPRIARSTVRDTWRWMWPDTAFRLLPFALATAVYAWFWGGKAAGIGLTAAYLPRDLLIGTAVGLPLAGLAALFRRWVAPGYRLPTRADQIVQTVFYFALNAPIEELFWRGMWQTLAVRAAAVPLGAGAAASAVGWAVATAIFGVYHRLGRWSWRSIAGVTAAGGVFGLAYLLQPTPRSIWLPTIIHAFATAGFLSWGDAALYLWDTRSRRMTKRNRIQRGGDT